MTRRGRRGRSAVRPVAGAGIRRRRGGLLAAGLGVIGLLAAAGAYRAVLSPEAGAEIGGPFQLVDGQGRAQSDRSLRGRFLLMFFGYTGCADICPTTLAVMSDVLDRVDPAAMRIQPVFITVDPAHDTEQKLRDYTARFSPTLLGLTGAPAQLQSLQRAFHVVVRGDGRDDAVDGVAHSAMLYLLGPDGRFRAAIPADIDGAALEAELRRVLAG